MITIKDICWLAGLLEGEGYFCAANNRGTATTFKIGIGMTDLDTIEKASWLLNGVLRVHSNGRLQDGSFSSYKKMYKTQVHGDRAISWMMTIYPLMSKRRKEKIKSIIIEWKAYIQKKDRCKTCGSQYDTIKIKTGLMRGLVQRFCRICRRNRAIRKRDVAKSLGLESKK